MSDLAWIRALSRLRNMFADEAELQLAVSRVLQQCLGDDSATTIAREHRFDPKSRIDFLVIAGGARIGVECKTKPNGMAVWRQLDRYADHLDALVLVTTAPVDRVLIPGKSDGTKIPFVLIELWKNL
jgi:DNA-binding sugar fermentation-stimulating protein